MRLTVDILRDFFLNLDFGLEVEDVTYSLSTGRSVVKVDRLIHLRKGMEVTFPEVLPDPAFNTRVLDTDSDALTLTVEGDATAYIDETLTIDPLFFLNGTPLKAAGEMQRVDLEKKYPMVYIAEVIRERFQPKMDALDRTADIRMFLIDQANWREWSTEQHYDITLSRLNNLAGVIMKAYRNEIGTFYAEETEFELINHVNFGTYQDGKGHTKMIFSDETSAVELNYDLNIFKSCKP